MPYTRQDLKEILGEGFHTAFRKATFCKEAPVIWTAISEMPPGDWDAVLEFVLDCLPDELI